MTTQPADMSLINRCIAAALEKLAEDAQREAQAPETTDAAERRHFKAWASAYRKALYYHLIGIKPEPTLNGAWLVPSATRGGMVHSVNKTGCTCEAGAHNGACWHAALTLGYEIGWDRVAVEDDAPTAPEDGYAEALSSLMECF